MKINFNVIANEFINFFNDREFSKIKEKELFNDTNSDIWWMNGSPSVFKFTGEKTIKNRIENLFPLVKGFDEWSFTATDILIDHKNNKIMVEVDVKGIGYGKNIYTNNYLFILSINKNGKIYLIREYLDASSVVQFSLNNTFISQQIKN